MNAGGSGITGKSHPQIESGLPMFIPLIVVNCIVLGRAEAFASRNTVLSSAVDGLGMGVGFTMALTLLGFIRELLGNLSVVGMKLIPADGMIIFILAPGAFITLAFMIAYRNWRDIQKKKKKKEERSADGKPAMVESN